MSVSPYIVGPAAGHPHTHTVILLHGRDSEAKEFASEFSECEATCPETDRILPALFPTIRWVFPQARPLCSERFDTEISQWFDMWAVEDPQARSELQLAGLQASIDQLGHVIKEEEMLVSRDRILLGGISQGFATAMAALFADGKGGFAGLCGFCSWLPLAAGAESVIREGKSPQDQFAPMQQLYLPGAGRQQGTLPVLQLTGMPILLEHSRDDNVVSIQNGVRMRDILMGLGFQNVEWHEYESGGHWINEPEGVDHLVNFLQRVAGGMRTDKR